MGIKEQEHKNRSSVQERKPIAWEKIQQIPKRIAEGKSIALMQLQYDYRCNMKCTHCAIEKFRDPGRDQLSITDVRNIADQAHEYGLSSICISGGEPLAFPDLSELIDAIGSHRFVLSMDTNGLKLDEEKVIWLVFKGVDRIHLSLDGLEENHSKFRKTSPLSWRHNVEMLDICKSYGLGVIINIVATKDLVRSREIEKQLEFLQQFGHHASLIYAKPVGSFEEAKDQVLNSDEMAYLETLTHKYNCSTHLTPAYGRETGCLCFKRHFSVTAYGDVLPCPWIPISMGNLLDERLETVLSRGLQNKWFKWGTCYPCHSGNCDSEFYQNIIPQIEKSDKYPADWKEIDW